MMKKIVWAVMALVVMFTSCNDDDYLNVIPGSSVALLSVDLQQMQQNAGEGSDGLAHSLCRALGISADEDMGVDMSSRLFFFESQDGAFGLAAKVADRKRVERFFGHLAEKGICQELTTNHGNSFTVVKGSWVAGIGNSALVVLGPVLPAQQTETVRQINAYFKQDDDMGIKSSPLFERLETMSSAVSLVAQAAALPEKFVAPFTLGTSDKTDLSQVLIAAEIERADGCLRVKSNTFSQNKQVNDDLVEAKKAFRPLNGVYHGQLSGADFCSLLMNANGGELLKLMQKNRSLTALLTGVNTAIDMNKILQGVDGEIAVIAHDTAPAVSVHAQLANDEFLKDVGYWMESCPEGASIRKDVKSEHSFIYQDKERKFFFWVTPDQQFKGQLVPNGSSLSPGKAMNPSAVKMLQGEKVCLLLNLEGLGSDEIVETIKSVLFPVTGSISTIICTMQ